MDIHKIFNFCAVVEYGSLSKAAEILYCSQPALTKQISSLEEELGYPLFDRNGKKMKVNETGQLVYQFGKHLERDFFQLKADMYNVNHDCGHEVSFGATNFIGIYLIPPILSEFKKNYPMVPVNFTVNFLPNIIHMLDQDIISFAAIPEDSSILCNPCYVCRLFKEDEMVVIFPPGHPLDTKTAVDKTALLMYPFLISQIQSATRSFILSRLSSYGIQLQNTIDMYKTETIKQGVINGMGISILSKSSVSGEMQAGLLKATTINGMNLIRKLYFIHKKTRPLTKEEQLFISCF